VVGRASAPYPPIRLHEERALNNWLEVRDDFTAWLRTFPLLTNIGKPGDYPELIGESDAPVYLDVAFWSERTHEAEARAERHLTDAEIDAIFDEVAAAIDGNLLRFDPLVAYYGRFFPDGDAGRIEAEREAAHSVKRDLAWAAIERAIGEPGFFSSLLARYDCGRWPVGWAGQFPAGHLRVL
jgi:hypothetical protein